MNCIDKIKEKLSVKGALKEHVKAAPKELVRRGLEDGTERLRTQLWDAAQGGQRDDNGGDGLEDAAAGGLRRTERGVERLLKQKKERRSAPQPTTGAKPEPPPQSGTAPPQTKPPESTWTEPRPAAATETHVPQATDTRTAVKTRETTQAQPPAAGTADRHRPQDSAARTAVKTREAAQAQPSSAGTADRHGPQDSAARPAVKTREAVHDGTPDITGGHSTPYGDSVIQPVRAEDAVRQTAFNKQPRSRAAEPAIKTRDARIHRQPAASGTGTPQVQAAGPGQAQRRAAAKEGVLRRRGPIGADAAEPAAQPVLPGGTNRPPGQRAGPPPKAAQENRSAKGPSHRPPPDTPQTVRQTVSRPTVKESRQTVKAAEYRMRKMAKKAEHAIKTVGAPSMPAGTVGRTTQAAAQARQAISARKAAAARRSMTRTRQAAKAAQTTAKKTTQAAGRALRAILAAAKSIGAAIGAGGVAVFVIILVICLVGLLAASPFGLFLSGEDSGTGYTMPEAVTLLNSEFSSRIEQIKASNPHDILEMDNAGSAIMISNWDDVLAVYAVRTATDDTAPNEVATLTEEKLSILREIFWDMNRISYWLEVIPGGEDMAEITVLHIAVTVKGHLQMADIYGFTRKQRALLLEMMAPEYQELFMALTGSYRDIELSPEQIRDIVNKLPPKSQ